MNDDRQVHATDEQSGVELVRYDRAGKWWLECDYWFPKTRTPVANVGEAAQWAVDHATVVHDRIGGKRFFSEFLKRQAAADAEVSR